MILQTKHFGELSIDEDLILSFDDGLPGFPDDKKFILLENSKDDSPDPFLWMQSVADGDTAFILMDVFSVMPDYKPDVNPGDIEDLGEYNDDSKEDFLIYNIVVLPEDIKKMSVNLVAPVIINQRMKKGKQVIVNNSEYNVRHYLFED